MGKLVAFVDFLEQEKTVKVTRQEQQKAVDLQVQHQQEILAAIKNIKVEKPDFTAVIKAMHKIKIPSMQPVLKAIDTIPAVSLSTLEDKIKRLESKLENLNKKKRRFAFKVEREEFSDLIKNVTATEQ